jgi:hypothetical protein
LKSLDSYFLVFLVNLPILMRYPSNIKLCSHLLFYLLFLASMNDTSGKNYLISSIYLISNIYISWIFRKFLRCMFIDAVFHLQPIRSPLTPGVLITGIVPSESSIFKSALHPLRLTFRTANGGTSKIIFKKGDDIRQDQLVFLQNLLTSSVCVCVMQCALAHKTHTLSLSLSLSLTHTHTHTLSHALGDRCSGNVSSIT